MARLLIIGGALAVIFWVFSVVDCAVQPATRHRGVPKRVWLAIVILVPVLGGILWFTLGRSGKRSHSQRPMAPEDDYGFLQSLSDMSAQDVRIAQLEEELAKLDAEEAAAKEVADSFGAPAKNGSSQPASPREPSDRTIKSEPVPNSDQNHTPRADGPATDQHT